MPASPCVATEPGHEDGPALAPDILSHAPHLSALRTVISWMLGVLALVAVIVAAAQYGSLSRTFAIARETSPRWLLLAFAAQAMTYVCSAAVWWCVLKAAGHPRRLFRLMGLGVAKVFTDQLLPSGGLSGNLLVVASLLRRQIPAPVAMAALLIGMTSFYAAYLAVAVAAAVLLWLHNRQSAALSGLIAAFLVLAVVLPGLVYWVRRGVARRLPGWATRIPLLPMLMRAMADAPASLLRDPRLLAEAVALQLSIFLLDATTLWLVMQSGDHAVAFWIPFVALIVASIIATIGPMPLGLGTFEGGAIGMLHLLGVPVETALAATMLLRGLTFWLPMLPGLWLARREIPQRARLTTGQATR